MRSPGIDRHRTTAIEEQERKCLREQKQALDALVQSWLDVDEQGAAEQRETLEILMKTLNNEGWEVEYVVSDKSPSTIGSGCEPDRGRTEKATD